MKHKTIMIKLTGNLIEHTAHELNASHKNPQTRDPQARDPQARDPQARDPQARDPQARDPQARDPQARLLKQISYAEALDKNLKVMDATAFALARTYNLTLRVFDIFTDNALIRAADDPSFGSTIAQT